MSSIRRGPPNNYKSFTFDIKISAKYERISKVSSGALIIDPHAPFSFSHFLGLKHDQGTLKMNINSKNSHSWLALPNFLNEMVPKRITKFDAFILLWLMSVKINVALDRLRFFLIKESITAAFHFFPFHCLLFWWLDILMHSFDIFVSSLVPRIFYLSNIHFFTDLNYLHIHRLVLISFSEFNHVTYPSLSSSFS